MKSVYICQIMSSFFLAKNTSMSSLQKIGSYIRRLRKERKETLHQVAKGTDIDSTILSKIERGIRLPTMLQLRNLGLYFEVSEGFLKSKLIAEKIIKDYGSNEMTYSAIQILNEELAVYAKNTKKNE